MPKKTSSSNRDQERGGRQNRGGYYPTGTLQDLLDHSDQLPRGPAPGASVSDDAPVAPVPPDSDHTK